MKFLLCGLLSMCCVSSALAAGAWKLVEVEDATKSVVGIIYHSESVGTATASSDRVSKLVTGLRLVCSTKDQNLGRNEMPVIAVYWNLMAGNSPQTPVIRVDGKQIESGQWNQEGQLLYRPINESPALMQALKIGKTVSFDWKGGDNIRRQTVFDLRDFKSDLTKFNASCKTYI